MDKRIFVLSLATFAMGTEAYVYVGHLDSLAKDLNIQVATAGQLATAFALTYALSAPFIAGSVSHIGRRTVIFSGLILVAVLNAVAAVAPDFQSLTLIRILCGLAAALVGPIASVAAAELAPPTQRGKAMAIVLAGMTLAFIAGVPAGSVIGEFAGWRGTFVYAGLIAAGAATIIRLVLPNMPGGARPRLSIVKVLAQGRIVTLLALTLLGFASTFAVIAFIGPVVTAITGLTGSGVGAIQALIGVGSIFGIVVGSRFADRPVALSIVVTSFVVSALSLATLSILFRAPSSVGIAGIALSITAGAAALFCRTPIIQTLLVVEAPEQRPIILALNGSMVFFGQGTGAALGGITIRFVGLDVLGWSAGVAAIIGAAFAYFASIHSGLRPTPTLEMPIPSIPTFGDKR